MSAQAPPRGGARRGGGYDRPAMHTRSNFELYSWFFMRISGILLLFLALYHLVWWNLIVGVEHLSADLVRERWENPFMRLYSIALAVFAMLHGLNGLRYSIEDYVRRPGWQVVAKAVSYTVILLALAWGVFALLAFNPEIAARP